MKRILIYTHNAIGLGHAVRTLAVVTGMRYWRPDIDFLVITGSSVPHIFLREGIEVIRLPGIRLNFDKGQSGLTPRYLKNFSLEEVFDYRQRVLLDAFDFFDPDVFMVEHNMSGLMSEVIPLLIKKWLRRSRNREFGLVHISRGIMRWAPSLNIPYKNPRHKSESIDVGHLYDALYVLEDQDTVNVNKEFLGNDPELEEKIQYLGRIAAKVPEELPTRTVVLSRFGLADKRIIIVTLGRHGGVFELMRSVLAAFKRTGLQQNYQIVLIMDPYLQQERVSSFRDDPLTEQALILPFIPNLVDLINCAELVVCRAGYNTVNEILMTNVKAMIVPEVHPSGEQERRAFSLPRENIEVTTEHELLTGTIDNQVLDLLQRPLQRNTFTFDKYTIGKRIITDLEKLFEQTRAISTD